LAIANDLQPMEARLVEALPDEPGWWFEPKWDGFRCLAFRAGDEVDLRGKSGKSLARFFPDVVAALRALPPQQFVIDGELAIPAGGVLSFAALQARLHPAASRVAKLAAEARAIVIAFDCLMDADGTSLVDAPFAERRAKLTALHQAFGPAAAVRLTPGTAARAEAQAWLERAGGDLDGVVAKRGPYAPGQRAMLKVKHFRTADCVVGGFRYETGTRRVGALLLGLYDEAGRLNHVGFTSAIADRERAALTRKLESLAGGAGFTGAAPGGPSRWSTERSAQWRPLRPELVAEVRYDHVTGARMRHGAGFVRWRPDKPPAQCGMDQLLSEARPAVLLRELGPAPRRGGRPSQA
jgi:ATP-dependent DNA ligase